MGWLGCFGWWLTEHATVASVVVSSLAAVAITVFTVKLWRVSKGQLVELQRRVRLAREEFISTHRPRIAIHSVESAHVGKVGGDPETAKLGAKLVFFNHGNSSATIGEVRGDIRNRRHPLPSGIPMPLLEWPPSKLASGCQGAISIVSDVNGQTARIVADGKESFIQCIGVIVYADDLGNLRRTGFCWRYDLGTERWLRTEQSEYEYAY